MAVLVILLFGEKKTFRSTPVFAAALCFRKSLEYKPPKLIPRKTDINQVSGLTGWVRSKVRSFEGAQFAFHLAAMFALRIETCVCSALRVEGFVPLKCKDHPLAPLLARVFAGRPSRYELCF